MRSSRRIVGWLVIMAVVFGRNDGSYGQERIPVEKGILDAQQAVVWYNIRLLPVEGQGWTDVKAPFDRLPIKAEEMVRPPVWGLSRNSAGIAVRFVTDATTIHARWTLTSTNLAMPHMPATGVSGLDLYVKDEKGGWKWLSVGQPRAQSNSSPLVSGIPEGTREYLLYLPLYNGVSSVEIGLDKQRFLAQPSAYLSKHDKPIVFYGTSITQGGCASRPGMVHTAIIGRKLNRPVINLGFSGNGKMEPELANLLSEIDASLYVLDCLPNMSASEVSERVIPFVQILRTAHSTTPILLVEDRSYSNSFLVTGSKERNTSNRKALRGCYEKLMSEGVKQIGYLEGEKLLGDDNEGTVDSSHPTDLGFLRQAEAILPILQSLLAE